MTVSSVEALQARFPAIPRADLEQMLTYTGGTLGHRWGLGDRPGVIVVDMTRSFVEDPSSPVYVPTGQQCIAAIRDILSATRSLGLPTFYTRGAPFEHEAEAGAWLRGRPLSALAAMNHPEDHEIVDTLAPGDDDIVVVKAKPSGFFGTQLQAMLNYRKVDSLIVTGVTTSGCIRGTVYDAFNLNYPIVIPVEGVADRSEISHQVELFDMAAKYADVITTAELLGSL